MSTEMQTKVQASPAQNFTPVQTGLLQKKSALCNTPGLVDDSKQDKEKLTLQRSSADQAGTTTVPRFGYDFSRVSVHSTRPGMIQAKLKINEPGDIYEQEADRVADAVMRMPELGVQRLPEEEPIQAKKNNSTTAGAPPAIEFSINSLRGGGRPLSESTRRYFEPKFGFDFSGVRVHTGTRASDAAIYLHSRAFTIGNNIVFDKGNYSPETSGGKRLLAHELTHVVQQSRVKKPRNINVSFLSEPQLQCIRFGTDGRLSVKQRSMILKAIAILKKVAAAPSFGRKWKAFFGIGAWRKYFSRMKLGRVPSLKKYKNAINIMQINLADTSKDLAIIKALRQRPDINGWTKVLGKPFVYIKAVAFTKGLDNIINLLLHEALHVAGFPGGRFIEPFYAIFEYKTGFPRFFGGAKIVRITQNLRGRDNVDITVSYTINKLYINEEIQIQIVKPENGNILGLPQSARQTTPAKLTIPKGRRRGKVKFTARDLGYSIALSNFKRGPYNIRIVNLSGKILLASKQFSFIRTKVHPIPPTILTKSDIA